MKFRLPPNVGSVTVGDISYTPDEQGYIDVEHADHAPQLISLGAAPPPVTVADAINEADALASMSEGDRARLDAAHHPDPDAEARVLDLTYQLTDAEKALEEERERNKRDSDDKDAEIARLRAAIDTAQQASATDAAADTATTSDDTSQTLDGHEERVEGGESSEQLPNFDEMSRDDMVAWMAAEPRKVVLSPSISKVNAREAIADYLAGHKLG
jgi:hypothetical protein